MNLLALLALAVVCLASDVQRPLELAANPSTKYVVAHFIVGNTDPYTLDDWKQDIFLAASKGIDAFSLNVGSDPWQPARVADAYSAAKMQGSFKLFLSFDMSAMKCDAEDAAAPLRTYIDTYRKHPNQLLFNGKPLVSTFAGQNCLFGTGDLNSAWNTAIKANREPIHFIPAFFVDPATFRDLPVMDGIFQWNSAWPMGNYDITFGPDSSYLSNLGGRSYMAGVSPWFFTHYGPDTWNKNWIYRGDNFLLAKRWELLIQNRNSVSIAQIMTWNDFGESHYVGPIHGAQPNSQAWVNGFDHQGWLDLVLYYSQAFKTGKYPAITKDRIFLWGRLYPASADPPPGADHVGRPDHWQWTSDKVWAVVLLISPATVTLKCGSSTSTAALPAGLGKMQLSLVSNCAVSAAVARKNATVLSLVPSGFGFSKTPPTYNFNAFVAASP
ncbi:glycoside hydrolase family 71 protein [Roridomyces roridus]|uniref:Glycoside hydrolase family 71 protein n=1 Tax=Roridomyces roridus TaxID=1738132 RepID=A0AAD7CJW5_9AGAR|nr:glycoside hydrolase family 71 protein [Roridomyces roridus]